MNQSVGIEIIQYWYPIPIYLPQLINFCCPKKFEPLPFFFGHNLKFIGFSTFLRYRKPKVIVDDNNNFYLWDLCNCLYFNGEIPLCLLKNLERLADVAKFRYTASSDIDISE